ncbi:Gx transporter family protein [Evansella cellulosilytica]|uniref:Heptaprenyl diphosphate synthase component I n=1 Tax=Evansella cellulosilytica (strain ATCC 21833 / DSM 2522 / FERM P-1141 / JCM 9156 / N-4) TaxID=649639 RepID=E6U1D9_EVAC2|nr:Gx transporter family protein [Evansella cellulosilytica]ADU29186.1 Heptaprenyl diphosphate synthase component I [Evansella cellulosilytica DSM 2522]
MTKNQRLVYIALLASQAVIIGLLERAIPFPFAFAPGAKLGLANIITVMAIYTLSTKDAAKVVGIRIVLTALLGGTISTFMYSAAGAVISFIGMWAVHKLGPSRVSMIGVSVTGAILHNVGQLSIASWIAQTWTVLLYLPVLSFIGVLSGIAVGIAANYLLTHVEKLHYYKELRDLRKV